MKPGAIDFVAVAQEITWCLLPRKRLNHLLSRAPARGVFGGVAVDDLATLVAQHDEHVKNPKRDGGDGEEVDAGESRSLITEKCPPALKRWPSVPDHVPGHRGLGDLDT